MDSRLTAVMSQMSLILNRGEPFLYRAPACLRNPHPDLLRTFVRLTFSHRGLFYPSFVELSEEMSY